MVVAASACNVVGDGVAVIFVGIVFANGGGSYFVVIAALVGRWGLLGGSGSGDGSSTCPLLRTSAFRELRPPSWASVFWEVVCSHGGACLHYNFQVLAQRINNKISNKTTFRRPRFLLTGTIVFTLLG